jgi:molecular chaperone GrpE
VNSQIHDEDKAPEQIVEPEVQERPTAEETEAADASSEEQGQVVTQAMVDAAQAKAQEYLDGWQRARAEFANYKKRVEREIKDSQSSAAGSVLKDIVPVIDDFERAMANVPDELKENAWIGGVGMILRKLNKILEDYNVTVIDPTGEVFDPNLHEAIGMDEATEKIAAGHVTATVQKGYLLGDRVLRPALVRVAQ